MFNERVKIERNRLGLTQEQLAKKLGISRSNLGNWEHGENVASQEMLNKLADVFNCSTDYLLGRTDYRTIFERFDTTSNLTKLKNEIKISEKLDNEKFNDIYLESYYDAENDIIYDKDGNRMNKYPDQIIFDKLYELGLLKKDEEINEKQLNVVLKFIENNKDMLKELINKNK